LIPVVLTPYVYVFEVDSWFATLTAHSPTINERTSLSYNHPVLTVSESILSRFLHRYIVAPRENKNESELTYHVKRVRHQGERVNGIAYTSDQSTGSSRTAALQKIRATLPIPTINSSKKNNVSITNKMIILLDLEKAMVEALLFARALGAAMVDESLEIPMSSASGVANLGPGLYDNGPAERRCKRGKEGKGDSP
jgi:hypothetical protein